MKTFNASEIIESFEALFPMSIKHSGTKGEIVIIESFEELDDWDCASGEYWANHLDQYCISADFDYNDLVRYGDSILFDYYFNLMIQNINNGNLSDCMNDIIDLKNEDHDSFFNSLTDHENELEVLRLYSKRV